MLLLKKRGRRRMREGGGGGGGGKEGPFVFLRLLPLLPFPLLLVFRRGGIRGRVGTGN
jgi:hypothetical protein